MNRPGCLPALRTLTAAISLSLAVALGTGCASTRSTVTDKKLQESTTPDAALARLVEGNQRFAAGKSLHHDYKAEYKATAAGQYPYAVVLSCIDSRTSPEILFDQGLGDVFAPRIAGNYANADILGSMEFATKVAGAKLILVVGHSECGAVKGAVDQVRLGNLTTVMQAIEPAASAVPASAGERTSKNKAYVSSLTEANVRRTVAEIRSKSEILATLEREGKLKIVGSLYDLKTGQVTVLN